MCSETASVSAPYLYALPSRDGQAVAGTQDWDDYDLWTSACTARGGWQQTLQRETQEYGMEFRQGGRSDSLLSLMAHPGSRRLVGDAFAVYSWHPSMHDHSA
jgi:hypothetical protein